jgi:phosphonate metabolism protein (transferase hexapeptide repeat family)
VSPGNGSSVAGVASASHGGARRVLGEQPWVDESSRVHDSHVGPWTWIGPRCSISEATFGDYSYMAGDGSIIYADVGKFCSIASHARINPGNHPMQRVTQHHLTYRRRMYDLGEADDEAFFDWRRAARVRVGHDVWLGHGAILLPGVQVGNGAVVAAGAVVSHDVAPYSVVAGVPARPLRERFPMHVVEQLEAIAWWDWTREQLEARLDDFLDMDLFLEKYAR